VSRPGETAGDFAARVDQALREQRDVAVGKLRVKYAPKLAALQERVRRAQERVEREESQYGHQKVQTAISIGATVLGALFGRKIVSSTSVGRAATAMRGASRAGRERKDVGRAKENLAHVREQLAQLEKEFEAEVQRLRPAGPSAQEAVQPLRIRPRKSDIAVAEVAVAWIPWKLSADGCVEPLP
jgi:hypothetical protein